MITLLTGIPGSGKSYMAVDHVSKMKDQSKVLHNIEGFKLGISLDQFSLDHNIKKLDVFRKSWHEKNDLLHGWTIIIDEAAELFPKSMRDTDVVSFFDYHRHYGIDIFLITQDIKKVTPDITCLAESHYRAASGASNPIPGILIYQQIVGGESVARKYLRKRKEVFALYKSTNNLSSGTVNIGKIYMVAALVGALVAAYSLKAWFNSMKPKQSAATSEVHKSTSDKKPITDRSYQVKKDDSLPSLLGGTPYPVSTIQDHAGLHVVFCGNIFRKENFPYSLVKTRTGLVALLPPAALSYAVQYQSKLDESIKNQASPLPSATERPELNTTLPDKSLASLAGQSERER